MGVDWKSSPVTRMHTDVMLQSYIKEACILRLSLAGCTYGGLSIHAHNVSLSGNACGSLRCADQRQTQRRHQLQAEAARDEYLLNLFRRADQNCTHQVEPAPWQPNGWTAPNMASRVPQPSHPQQNHPQQNQLGMGQMGARPTFNLPGYPAHGPLPLHGNPAGAGSQEPHKVDAAGSEGRLSNMVDMQEAAPGSAKVLT